MTIDEEYNCLGYFGFGTGISLAKGIGSAYCNGCPKRDACWEIHRGRVHELFPELAAMIDELGKKENGNKLIMEFIQKNNASEPFISVMTGNIQDAMSIVHTGKPQDRGPYTLEYPFKDMSDESSKN